VPQAITIGARHHPEKVALIQGDTRITYQQLNEESNRVSNGLRSLGVEKGDKIALLLTDSIYFVELWYGAVKAGAVPVTINYRLNREEILYQVAYSESKVLVTESQLFENAKDLPSTLGLRAFISLDFRIEKSIYFVNFKKASSAETPAIDLAAGDPCWIRYTSGTTGKPKAAVLSHGSIMFCAAQWAREYDLKYRTVYASVFPLSGGGTYFVVANHYAGATVILYSRFDPAEIAKSVEREKVTTLIMAPTMYNMFLNFVENERKKYDLSSVTTVVSCASPLSSKTVGRLTNEFPNAGLHNGYGTSEMAGNATNLKPEEFAQKGTSVGRPVSGWEIRVVDEEGRDLPTGQAGRIVVRGPNLFLGYYKDEEGTKKAFLGDWFGTGDIGRFDEDGYLYLVDRYHDMIISGGFNIYAIEVEMILNSHPEIAEAAVIGAPDEVWGEVVKAVVVLRDGSHLTAEKIIEYCSRRMSSYKKPRKIEIVEELPKNWMGKIDKQELRKRSGNGIALGSFQGGIGER
jgi:acyl-CoA synthetase (AMP-forming)/AMP-acid ligase II